MAKKPRKTVKTAETQQITNADELQIMNSLSGLAALTASSSLGNIQQVSKSDTININVDRNLLAYNRELLSSMYVKLGIVQTLIDQPVDDAFRGGITIKTEMLSPEELEELEAYIRDNNFIEKFKQALKWKRLFGGSGLVLMTSQDPTKPFELDKMNKYSPLDFYPADMWELNMAWHKSQNPKLEIKEDEDDELPYNFYGLALDPSRVLRMNGKEAPSFVRRRLRGWGMPEPERLIRSLNQYLKNTDVVFELLDEAKVDAFKITGFNSSLLTNDGTAKIAQRVQTGNQIKNFQNALVMDAEDDWQQKNMTFSGLSDMLIQIRQAVACDVKMPVTKLFGVSSAGFNSGEDDIENYNAMIETEIRSRELGNLSLMIKICCQKLFEVVPDDIYIEFEPLRVLSAEQEENVKNAVFNRVMSAVASGIMSPQEAKEAINRENLVPVEIEESDDITPIEGVDGVSTGGLS